MTLRDFLDEWNNGNDCVLVHTSGSTGTPKPLWVEKSRMAASARTTCDFLSLQPGDVALLCMPLDFIAGKMMVVRALERNMQLVDVTPSGHPLATLSRHIDFAAMVPMQVSNSLQSRVERERLMDIRHLIIGGGAIDEALEKELRHFPHAVWSTYGMTETLSHIALRRLNGPEASDYYTPFSGVEVSLNADGCLVIDAPLVCKSTLVTHDVAQFSPDGRSFRIIGRIDNVICSGGIKVQIEEVERLLMPHIPVPFMITKRKDAKFGEAVAILFEAAPDESLLKSICEEQLPKYWQPRYYIPVDRLPMTGTGKPARHEAEIMAGRLPC